MKLFSDRLEFTSFTYDDFEGLYDILSDDEVCKYLPGQKGKSEEEVNKWLHHFVRMFDDENGTKVFAIREKGKTPLIGYGGLGYVKEFDQIEILYGFHKQVWGKGFATETSFRMKDLAIDEGLDFVIALADINNIPSQRILLKTGFEQVKEMELWGLELYYYEMKLEEEKEAS